MHVPDGFLTGPVLATSAALAVAGVGLAVRQARHALPRRKVPLMGLGAAFIFAAQMINFPVAAGTSGHLIGGTLAAILLGPGPAVLVVTAVLIVQCFLFADGGLLALGANVLNMAVVDALAGYFAYCVLRRALPKSNAGRFTAAFAAAWFGTVLAALVCSGQLVLSGRGAPHTVFAVMGGIHTLIGIGEGLITAMVVATVARTRPELLADESSVRGFEVIIDKETGTGTVSAPARPSSLRPFLAYGVVVSLAVALFLSPFASTAPDGLDKTSEKLGFADRAAQTPHAPPAPDYRLPGIASAKLATSTAGVAGTIAVAVLTLLLGRVIFPKPADEQS